MGVTRGWPPVYCTAVERADPGGELYCRRHDPGDPEENRRRRMALHAEREARLDAEAARSRRRRLEEDVCKNLTDEQLQQIIDLGGLS